MHANTSANLQTMDIQAICQSADHTCMMVLLCSHLPPPRPLLVVHSAPNPWIRQCVVCISRILLNHSQVRPSCQGLESKADVWVDNLAILAGLSCCDDYQLPPKRRSRSQKVATRRSCNPQAQERGRRGMIQAAFEPLRVCCSSKSILKVSEVPKPLGVPAKLKPGR